MLYLIIGLTCLGIGGFSGYRIGYYLGREDSEEELFDSLTEEQQEYIGLHKR